jgi:hypothetical protein
MGINHPETPRVGQAKGRLNAIEWNIHTVQLLAENLDTSELQRNALIRNT